MAEGFATNRNVSIFYQGLFLHLTPDSALMRLDDGRRSENMWTSLGSALSQEFFRKYYFAFEKALVSGFHCISDSHSLHILSAERPRAALLASAIVFFEVFLAALTCRLQYLRDEQLVELHSMLFE